MKRFFSIMAVVAALFSASSCDYCDCKPLDPSQYSTQWTILDFNVAANNWEFCTIQADGTTFYRATLNVPELTESLFKEGLVTVAVYTGSNTLAPLPYTYYHKGTYDNGAEALWQEKFDYEFEPGKIFLYNTVSDFQYPDGAPSGWKFKVTLTY